jgi:hypothetical protein
MVKCRYKHTVWIIPDYCLDYFQILAQYDKKKTTSVV